MRVIGIDPGSRICGWGVVEEAPGPRKLVHVDNGAIFAETVKDLPSRLQMVYEQLRRVIETYRPDEAAIEQVFHAKSAKSALVLGQARGVAILACVHAGVPVNEYSATQIKQAVSGYGHADKQQVAMLVKTLLNLPETAWQDAADALAGAICHLNSHRMLRATERAKNKAAPR